MSAIVCVAPLVTGIVTVAEGLGELQPAFERTPASVPDIVVLLTSNARLGCSRTLSLRSAAPTLEPFGPRYKTKINSFL